MRCIHTGQNDSQGELQSSGSYECPPCRPASRRAVGTTSNEVPPGGLASIRPVAAHLSCNIPGVDPDRFLIGPPWAKGAKPHLLRLRSCLQRCQRQTAATVTSNGLGRLTEVQAQWMGPANINTERTRDRSGRNSGRKVSPPPVRPRNPGQWRGISLHRISPLKNRGCSRTVRKRPAGTSRRPQFKCWQPCCRFLLRAARRRQQQPRS